jgi:hypothetical protein
LVRERFTLDVVDTIADKPSDEIAQDFVTLLESLSSSANARMVPDEPCSAAADTASPWEAFTRLPASCGSETSEAALTGVDAFSSSPESDPQDWSEKATAMTHFHPPS